MKGDLHPVAFALSQRLPVRTHLAPQPADRRQVTGKPTSGQAAIRCKGVDYPSVTEAMRRTRVGYQTIKKWLTNGSAEYV